MQQTQNPGTTNNLKLDPEVCLRGELSTFSGATPKGPPI